jgi:2'-5' RNA ligase
LARARVIWAGVAAKDSAPLLELKRAVVRELSSVGYRPDQERFTPHVTLGRIRSDRRPSSSRDVTGNLKPYLEWSGGTFQVSEVVTFASTLTRDGPAYAALARGSLLGEKPAVAP